ncbi:MAG: hypothetical protein WAX04_08180 [Oscillospiraceae bacterium]
MNKTLKTVLITLAITIVALFAIIMIFGENTSIPMGSSSNIEKNSSPESEESPGNASLNTDESSSIAANGTSSSDNSTKSPAADVSEELFAKAVSYDVFDWNMADDQGKNEIIENIMRVWDANGSDYALTSKDLVTYINQNLSDQANIFEIACIAVQIDPQPYLNRTN